VEIFTRTCNYDVMDSERIAARLFVGLGGLVWVVLAWGSAIVYPTTSALTNLVPALLVLVLAVIALAIGWFFENLAGVLLIAGAVATAVWGVMAGWEPGVWGLMAIVLIAPEVIAGVLFFSAARMQKVCELAGSR